MCSQGTAVPLLLVEHNCLTRSHHKHLGSVQDLPTSGEMNTYLQRTFSGSDEALFLAWLSWDQQMFGRRLEQLGYRAGRVELCQVHSYPLDVKCVTAQQRGDLAVRAQSQSEPVELCTLLSGSQ